MLLDKISFTDLDLTSYEIFFPQQKRGKIPSNWHRIELEIPIRYSFETDQIVELITNWAKANIYDHYSIYSTYNPNRVTYNFVIHFENESEAVLFKLADVVQNLNP